MKDSDVITVCDKCFRASCWQGVFLCEESMSAGTVEKTIDELKGLALEHADFWKNELNLYIKAEKLERSREIDTESFRLLLEAIYDQANVHGPLWSILKAALKEVRGTVRKALDALPSTGKRRH